MTRRSNDNCSQRIGCGAIRIVLAAKRNAVHGKGDRGKKHAGRSAVFILGGGSPKNFLLQTEPQIQEVLGIDERGHDYFL